MAMELTNVFEELAMRRAEVEALRRRCRALRLALERVTLFSDRVGKLTGDWPKRIAQEAIDADDETAGR